MDTFAWLLIGHLVGDWVLQNDWMAKGKKRRLAGAAGPVHYAIYTASVLAALCLWGQERLSPAFYAVAGGVVFVSHWLLDGTPVVRAWMSVYRQTNAAVVSLMVDQTLHLLVLAGLAAAAI